MEKKKLAIFDFDGTLTSRDSMIEFVRYYRGSFKLYLSFFFLFPWLAGVKLGIANRESTKKRFLKWHLAGEKETDIRKKARMFVQQVLPSFLREKGLDQIQFHRTHQHEIIVITASLDLWVDSWFTPMGLKYLCTRAEIVDGVFTGEFITPNCSGEEKVRRLREIVNPDDYGTIFAYGDTSEDKAFMRLATHKYFKPFRSPVKKTFVE